MRHMATLPTSNPPALPLHRLILGSGGDRVLLLTSLLAVILIWFYISAQLTSGPTVAEIYSGKQLLATYVLPTAEQAPIHFEAKGPLGTSSIEIASNGARIEHSPCTTQRCVLSGTHSHAGDIIACVPNHILVVLRGGKQEGFDAIVE